MFSEVMKMGLFTKKVFRGVKLFVVCMGKVKTKEDKPYKTNGEGGQTSP
jgi:hypothetical protein